MLISKTLKVICNKIESEPKESSRFRSINLNNKSRELHNKQKEWEKNSTKIKKRKRSKYHSIKTRYKS